MKNIKDLYFHQKTIDKITKACKFCLNAQPDDVIHSIHYDEYREKYHITMSHSLERIWGTMITLDEKFVRSAINHLKKGRLNKWSATNMCLKISALK